MGGARGQPIKGFHSSGPRASTSLCSSLIIVRTQLVKQFHCALVEIDMVFEYLEIDSRSAGTLNCRPEDTARPPVQYRIKYVNTSAIKNSKFKNKHLIFVTVLHRKMKKKTFIQACKICACLNVSAKA